MVAMLQKAGLKGVEIVKEDKCFVMLAAQEAVTAGYDEKAAPFFVTFSRLLAGARPRVILLVYPLCMHTCSHSE